jgi:uncharacterized membrane protein YoaK (UPF0700 family)
MGMTGNTTQLVLDAVDLIRGVEVNQVAMVRARFGRMFQGIISFAAGGAVAAILFYIAGFWCLAMPVAIGATTTIS